VEVIGVTHTTRADPGKREVVVGGMQQAFKGVAPTAVILVSDVTVASSVSCSYSTNVTGIGFCSPGDIGAELSESARTAASPTTRPNASTQMDPCRITNFLCFSLSIELDSLLVTINLFSFDRSKQIDRS
jgi:hypothetical protein